jgi:hypothetical protein
MTLTSSQLQDNYNYFTLAYICQMSSVMVTDFNAASNTYSLSQDSQSRQIYIDSWSNSDCDEPTDQQMMAMFNPDDYVPYKKSLDLQQTVVSLPSVTNTDYTQVVNNQAIAAQTLLYNSDLKQIFFKVNSTYWKSIINVS